jgi:hypothetical protein
VKKLLWLLLLCQAGVAKPLLNFAVPTRSYHKLSWPSGHIWVEQSLWKRESSLAQAASDRLGSNWEASCRAVPSRARMGLKKMDIFLMDGPESPLGGQEQGLEYFRAGAPSYRPEVDPRWSDCIVVYYAKNYLDQSDLWARKAVQHEMAHAYHLRKWPEGQPPELYAAYQNALKEGLYCQVRDNEGRLHARAYALTNALEYFAELSCMLWACCNYPPCEAKELKAYDPQGYATVREMWSASGK